MKRIDCCFLRLYIESHLNIFGVTHPTPLLSSNPKLSWECWRTDRQTDGTKCIISRLRVIMQLVISWTWSIGFEFMFRYYVLCHAWSFRYYKFQVLQLFIILSRHSSLVWRSAVIHCLSRTHIDDICKEQVPRKGSLLLISFIGLKCLRPPYRVN